MEHTRKLYGNTYSGMSEREETHASLARKAAAESFVLLKNEGALPLRKGKIALYGTGARKTVAGGTGSGDVQKRYAVSIEQGLENAGYEITTKTYLDDYDREYAEAYRRWHDQVETEIAEIEHPIMALMKAQEYSFRYPAGRLITKEEIKQSDTDTAVYVLMRQAGEGNDRKLEQGDYLLTDIEYHNLELVSEAYRHTIVVINVGGMIDLGFMDRLNGIDALVFYVQGGMEGGNALADVLSGKVNFSGKLADSWPMRYEDIPYGSDYSYLNGNLDNENYAEGIYVGYRYYDTFGVKPRFPFGYGLSYSTFEVQSKQVKIQGRTVQVYADVTNCGSYAGKEVVQLYLSCPDKNQKKEYQSLVGFEKTQEIKPGETVEVQMTFDFGKGASFDEARSCWVLEEGVYCLLIGNSSKDTKPAAYFRLDREVITEQCRSLCAPAEKVKEISHARAHFPTWECGEVPVIRVDETAFQTVIHRYHEERTEQETPEVREILDRLAIEEMAELVRGADLQSDPAGMHNILGACGRTATTLLDKGLCNVLFADGPAGINIVEHARLQEDGTEKATEVPEKYNWGQAAELLRKKNVAKSGIDIYRYATAWPVEELLAQSWNLPLVQRIGDAVGREMQEFGITLWLAPGMNIHRNPLCGRTFEYFSEDPYLSGKMAAALTRGVQAHKGIGTTIKHFCANNQEDNRNYVSSNMNERTLREIYLKGFEIAISESNPMAVMTSYNKLNGVYTANNKELLAGILRGEWGYDGLVMTDWSSCGDSGNGNPALCIPAGNDLVMPGSDYDRECIKEALAEGRIQEKELRVSVARVLKIILNGIRRSV